MIYTLFSMMTGLFFGHTALAQDKSSNDPQTLFFESVASFNKNELDKAYTMMSEYLALRPNDPKGHFNMAAIEAKRKNWGSAAGHFRRALSIDPQIEGQGIMAQSIAQGAPNSNGLRGPFFRVARPVILSLSPLLILFVSLVSFSAWGHFYITYLKKRKWARSSEQPMPNLNWMIPIMGLVFVITIALYGTMTYLRSMDLGTILKANTSVYSAPNAESFELGSLAEASEVRILKKSGDWTQVTNDSELSGWVQSQNILRHKGQSQ